MSIGRRLRQAIDDSSMNIAEFGVSAGIPYRTLQQYLSDNRAPAAEVLIKICTQTSIDIHWLLTGQGSMYRDQPTVNPEESLDQRNTALLTLFAALNEDQQREILAAAQEKERLNKMEQQLSGLLKKLG